MAFNVWQPKGHPAALVGNCNPNVIYEGNPQVLAGPNVFKMWAGKNTGAVGVDYFESADGITNWTAYGSNPVVTGSNPNVTFPTVYKVGSTYYLYHGTYTGGAGLYVRTSANGIAWSAPTLAVPIGGGGDWDSVGIAQLNLVPPLTGPTYFGYYVGLNAHVQIGLVTSTDLINWTKYSGNPLIDFCSACTLQTAGGTYYMWAPHGGPPVSLSSQNLGFNGLNRFSSKSPSGPWTALTIGAQLVPVNYPAIQVDFDINGTGINNKGTNISDPCIISALGNMYIYWTRTDNVGFQYGINCSMATSVSPTQLVATYEGVQSFPIPMLPALNQTTLASDNFTRANANPIGGNWTPVGTSGSFQTSQILSNFVSPSATTSADGDSFYSSISWPNDQWSMNTLQTCTAVDIGTSVRASVNNEYILQWNGTLGSNGILTLYSCITGSFVLLGQLQILKASTGDTLMLVVSGTNLLAYYNGWPVLAATNSGIATGSAGFYNNVLGGAVTTSQISAWSGGGFVAAPNAPSLSGNTGSGLGIGFGDNPNRCCSKMQP